MLEETGRPAELINVSQISSSVPLPLYPFLLGSSGDFNDTSPDSNFFQISFGIFINQFRFFDRIYLCDSTGLFGSFSKTFLRILSFFRNYSGELCEIMNLL